MTPATHLTPSQITANRSRIYRERGKLPNSETVGGGDVADMVPEASFVRDRTDKLDFNKPKPLLPRRQR